jgi:hypothetical protein
VHVEVGEPAGERQQLRSPRADGCAIERRGAWKTAAVGIVDEAGDAPRDPKSKVGRDELVDAPREAWRRKHRCDQLLVGGAALRLQGATLLDLANGLEHAE